MTTSMYSHNNYYFEALMSRSKKETHVEDLIVLSEEILNDFELGKLPLENIVIKCKKLARLRNDFEAQNWFTLELNGYDKNNIPDGIKATDLFNYAKLSCRTVKYTNPVTTQIENKYWIASIPELEAIINSVKVELENIIPPTEFTPTITTSSSKNRYGEYSNSHEKETYRDILKHLQTQRTALTEQIKSNTSLLSKIRSSLYSYVLNIYYQLKFENITESIFQKTKVSVDKKLQKICPSALKKFVAVFDRLTSDNPEEWSQSMSSCRNILKEFADHVFPPQDLPYIMANGDSLSVKDNNYINRLLAYIDTNAKGSKKKYLLGRICELEKRVHTLNELLSKGTHAGIDFTDVTICVFDTYFLLANLINLQ